jgi:hypothetical protein
MIDIVIQCAAGKAPHAGVFRALDGRQVRFVARPELCGSEVNVIFARPDDTSDVPNRTWRARLLDYVAMNGQENPFGLFKAYQLYNHKAYAALVRTFGEQHVFVLSAAWGLIRADHLTPAYDVTFNRRAKLKKPEAFVANTSTYDYFQQLPPDTGPIVFLGGKDYLPLLETLTASLRRQRIVFVRAGDLGLSNARRTPIGMRFKPYPVAAKTNWHYQCALSLAHGKISLETFE